MAKRISHELRDSGRRWGTRIFGGRCPHCGRICAGEPFPPRCYDDISFVRDVPTRSVARSMKELLGRDGGGPHDEGGRRHEHGRVEVRHR